MCCDLSENIPTATERMTKKFSIYLLGMSNHMIKFIFKSSQYSFVASLCWYVCFKVFFKKYDFASLIFTVLEFQEMGTKPLLLSFQLVIFQYPKKHLTKIVHWPDYGIVIESSKCWEN